MNRWTRPFVAATALLALSGLAFAACGDDDDDEPTPTSTSSSEATASATTTATASASATEAEPELEGELIVYSGRSEALIQPIIDRFEEETGVAVEVKYGNTTELAALLAEEGDASPADVYFAQDAGALGAVQKLGLFAPLDEDVLAIVDDKYRSATGEWVGVTARARVIIYNPELVAEADLPTSILDLTDAAWNGKVGWAPTNASFQSQMTAFRLLDGDDAAAEWLEAMKANGVRDYPGNGDIVSAVAAGEISVGLVNHYYVWGFIRDQGEGFKARNAYTDGGDIGSLVNVAGAGILANGANQAAAAAFIEFLMSEEAQVYFAENTFEYPLADGIDADERFVPLAEIEPPDLDLSDIDDLEGTLALLRETGVLP